MFGVIKLIVQGVAYLLLISIASPLLLMFGRVQQAPKPQEVTIDPELLEDDSGIDVDEAYT